MTAPTSRKSSSSKPRIVAAGVPIRIPEATVGGRSSKGTVFRLTVSFTSASRSSASLPRPLGRAQVDLQQVRVGAAGEHVEPALLQRSRERVGVRAHLAPGTRGTPRSPRSRKQVAFAAIVCTSGPPCIPGKTARSTACACSSRAEDEAGARAGERLVRRRGDEVAVLDRVRVQPGRDEPGEMGHVAEEQRADLVGDLAEAVGLDRARVRGAAADDQLRPVLLREREHLVVVDDVRLARDAVVDDRVEPARRS